MAKLQENSSLPERKSMPMSVPTPTCTSVSAVPPAPTGLLPHSQHPITPRLAGLGAHLFSIIHNTSHLLPPCKPSLLCKVRDRRSPLRQGGGGQEEKRTGAGEGGRARDRKAGRWVKGGGRRKRRGEGAGERGGRGWEGGEEEEGRGRGGGGRGRLLKGRAFSHENALWLVPISIPVHNEGPAHCHANQFG